MKNVSVRSAEWNPNNQIIVTIADMEGGAFVKSTTRKVVFENVAEKDATQETVKSLLAQQGFSTESRFNVD